jgi:hypothetical protein
MGMNSLHGWANLPSFSAFAKGLKRIEAENRWGRLTQVNHLSRFALLNPVLTCGNFVRNPSLPQG